MTNGGDDSLDEFDLPVVGGGRPAVSDNTPTPAQQPVQAEQTFIMSQDDLLAASQAVAEEPVLPSPGFGDAAPASFDSETTDLMAVMDVAPPSVDHAPPPSGVPDVATTMDYSGPPAIQTHLQAGQRVAGVTLVELISEGDRVSCWRAEAGGGSSATVLALHDGTSERERAHFVAAAERMTNLARTESIDGVLNVTSVDVASSAYVASFSAAGTMADLPMLNWEFAEKLAFIRGLLTALGELHDRGHFHGCLQPSNVLLDLDLKPVISDVGVVRLADSFGMHERHEYRPYAAPEVAMGEPPREGADVFSVGRLLYFLLVGEHPDEPDEILPLLDQLQGNAPGLVRIIRKCTVRDPAQRYGRCRVLMHDLDRYRDFESVGLQHPQGKEGAEELARQREAAAEARKSSPDRRATGDTTRPKRPSTRAKKPDITSRQKAIKKKTYAGDDPFTPAQARIGGVVGVVLIGFACTLAYTSMKVNIVGTLMLVIGAGGLSLFLPTFGDRDDVSRIAGIAICALIAFLADPLENLALSGRQAKLKSGSPGQRAEVVKQMRLDGWGDFSDVDLNGADLSGTDFSMSGFDRANLREANFSGCNFEDASFEEADVTNTNFKEAKMPISMIAANLKGWRQSKCDQKTQMPDGWQCSGGHPEAGGDEVVEEEEQPEEEVQEDDAP